MNQLVKTVQWATPMDVSIRIVNLLLSYDILHQLDKNNYLDSLSLKNNFHKLIEVSLKFVIDRLEYSGKGCGSNHYLSNIVGIILRHIYQIVPGIMRIWYLEFRELIRASKRKQFYLEGHFRRGLQVIIDLVQDL